MNAAFERISAWLATCSSNHARCTRKDMNFMPHRVLDVGLIQEGDRGEQKKNKGDRAIRV